MWNNIKSTLVAVFVVGGWVLSVSAQQKPALREDKTPAIEVVRVNPSAGDRRRLQNKLKAEAAVTGLAAVTREEPVHVIKLHVNMPPAQDKACALYVGAA